MDGGSQKTGGKGKPLSGNQKASAEPQAGSKPKLFGNPQPNQPGASGNKDQLAAPVQPPMKKFTTSDEAKIGDMSFKPIADGKYPEPTPNKPANNPKPVVVPKPSTLPKPDPKPAVSPPAKEKDLQDDWSQEFNDKGLKDTKTSAPVSQKPGPTAPPKVTPPAPALSNSGVAVQKPAQPAAKQPAPAEEAFNLDDF